MKHFYDCFYKDPKARMEVSVASGHVEQGVELNNIADQVFPLAL